ncbi:MAG: polyamine ABC transporter substrate-binding protein [Curvibacter sp. RIFCSPHIGHO2_12_FULL_63_18]|uniref:ABC transporter permease n=1 Tax=Rhodoferax sp. TaxID=50421 RepID=UPI0008CD752C|nr:ABC transporter permease [Rhodoferax sp.]OGO94991.1 MAG: polyamine ABC transporter substrate-binding protein [Curvibacter sp. GWA2_63_95]OGP05227.1 MAG: polyamine ABC transporter substrate-binding protein [Curvibacter sp. RIFCSPHIGHO2_12_FULL_63_18]HCX82320.1 polyamine ABC transporter substrate-binding protein [Rhodoferax sp.]
MQASAIQPPGDLRAALSRAESRRKWRAFSLTLPLLVFLLLTLLVPIAALLMRAVENPEVAKALPTTVEALAGWDRTSQPQAAAYAALVQDLSHLPDTADAGALARRLNTEAPGARSLIMGAYKALPIEGDAASVRQQLLDKDARWAEPEFWQAIAKNGARWTPDYLLASVDLKRDANGHIERMPEDQRAYGGILVRTFQISFIVTLLCLVLAYPLAYWLSTLPERKANVLMILVLVPFWTSILVRVAAWIVLLQSEGLVNGALLGIGVISEPLALLFNRTGVIISMVHILLPFMILPLYSVMKSVPPTYVRAAVSLGSAPLAAFVRVYVPQTFPGVGAGALLVFILAIGYYITPALLGGADDQMLSYYIARYTNVEVNWGMACALGALLLATTLVLYAVYRRIGKSDLALA